jgi:TRAP transporter TAXI family solute receptor
MSLFKKVCLLILLFIFLFGIQNVWAGDTTRLSISTGAMGGGFYPIGGGIAAYISKNVEDVEVTAATSGGVDENMNRLDSGEADIALVSTGDSYKAFKGMPPYDHEFNKMRGMGILFANWGQPYSLKKSGINTYLDLKNKNVCVGSPGGSMHRLFYDWVKIHGLDPEKDFKKSVFLPASAAMEALKMGQVDVVMEIAAIPTSSITELSLTDNIQIIQFASGYREKLIEASPEYLPMTIPAGTYKGMDEDVETVGMAAMWACRMDLPDEMVYNLVKSIYSTEGLEYLATVHPAASGITLENAAKWTPIPLHPGAEKFFKEVGLID